jgi:hypothetical protein
VPIIEQGYQYTVTFEVRDVFGDNSCHADTGMLIVQNHLVNESNRVDTLSISGGMAEYSFIPGGPNLIAPYLKNLTATAYLGKETAQKSVDVPVEGNRPKEQTFTTISPEIPFMILRDPPGDASYSSVETEIWGKVRGSLEVGASVSGQERAGHLPLQARTV